MSKTQDKSFSDSLKELEEIVAWFEREDVDLDEALAKFEKGVQLSKGLKAYLKNTENKIKEIKATHQQSTE